MATGVRAPVEMLATFAVGGQLGQTRAEIVSGEDGTLTVLTRRMVRGLEVVDLPRRVESARDLFEMLTR